MASPDVVPPRDTAGANHDSPEAFAILLFAAKDLAAADFTDAIGLLEQFVAAQPPAPYAWIKDYKPLAQKYLDDLRLYHAWKEQTKNLASPQAREAALADLRGIERRLQTQGQLADQIKTEAAQLSPQLARPTPNAAPSRAVPNGPNFAKEKSIWLAALSQYRQQVLDYNFPAALSAVSRPQLSDASLQHEQENGKTKAKWLIDWQTRLIADLNRARFSGLIADRVGTHYSGVIRATPNELVLKNSIGSATVPWSKLPPQMLLAMADSYIRSGAPDVADRQWLSAVFASETGQIDTARHFAEAAASKPEYRALLPLLSLGR